MHLLRHLLRSGGLYVIGQMIGKVHQAAQQESSEGVYGCDEERFQAWLKDPGPIYFRGDWGNMKPDSKRLEEEVSYFTIESLGYQDLASAMKFKGSTSWLFETKDLAQDDYGGFVKVIGVIKTVLECLTRRGMLKSVDESILFLAEEEEVDEEGEEDEEERDEEERDEEERDEEEGGEEEEEEEGDEEEEDEEEEEEEELGEQEKEDWELLATEYDPPACELAYEEKLGNMSEKSGSEEKEHMPV
ncbi:hypothetical protein V8F20_003212 [Naviculisporaceae sp. PSN 640]